MGTFRRGAGATGEDEGAQDETNRWNQAPHAPMLVPCGGRSQGRSRAQAPHFVHAPFPSVSGGKVLDLSRVTLRCRTRGRPEVRPPVLEGAIAQPVRAQH